MTKNDLHFLTRFLPAKTRIPALNLASWNKQGEVVTTDLEHWALVATDLRPESDTLLDVKYAATLAKSKSTFGVQGDALTVDNREVPAVNFGVEDFPVWPIPKNIRAYTTFQPGELQNAITTVLPSVAKEESRPVLTGVCFDFTAGETPVVVTTDTHRLTIVPVNPKIEEVGASLNEQFIVPVDVLRKLLPFLKDVKTPIQVTFTDTSTAINFDNKTLFMLNTPGMFPAYRRVVPQAAGTLVSVSRADLSARLQDYLAVAKLRKVSTLRFILQPGPDTLSSLTTLSGNIDGDTPYVPGPIEASRPIPFPVAFNGKYLLDITNQFPMSGYVTFAFGDDALRPAKITGTGSDTLVVLMPMHVTG